MTLSPPIAIADRIRTLPRRDGRPLLVAIDGPGGAGKTWLACALADELARAETVVAIVHGDDFARPRAERPSGATAAKPIGGDFDWQRLRDDVLAPLRQGREARYTRYDWDRDVRADEIVVGPAAVVVVEGIYACRRELRSLYDLRIWVECARAIRLARGLARDGEAARARWEDDWMPSEDRYVREHEPRAAADVIVRGDAPTFAVRPAEDTDSN